LIKCNNIENRKIDKLNKELDVYGFKHRNNYPIKSMGDDIEEHEENEEIGEMEEIEEIGEMDELKLTNKENDNDDFV
jgi:predicted transglutaminase-like cysteine proteinase